MTRKSDLRVEYRMNTGEFPFNIGNWVTDELRYDYARWLEEQLIEARNKIKELKNEY